MSLLVALSARAPASPGGPAGCRHCGAPLEVPEGARVVACLYCRSENAVRISTRLVRAVRAHVGSLGRRIADAAEADRRDRRATARELLRAALRHLAVGGAFAVLFGIYAVDYQRAEQAGGFEAPKWGISAIVGAAVLFLVLVIISVTSRARERDEARARRSGNDVPDWVRVVGPAGVLGLVWLAVRLVAC